MTTANGDTVFLRRSGETAEFKYRSSRFFQANGQWFFDTREQTHIGPFSNQATATQALTLYIREISSENSSFRAAKSRANNGSWAITHYK